MEALPEDCLGYIVSLMTPVEACRLAAVSKPLRSMVNSDVVWSQFNFLPKNWEWVVSSALEPPSRVLAALSSNDVFVRFYCHNRHPLKRSRELFVGRVFLFGTWKFNFKPIPDDPLSSYLVVSDRKVKSSNAWQITNPKSKSEVPHDVRTLTIGTTYAIYFVFDLRWIMFPFEMIMFQIPVELRVYLSFERMMGERGEEKHILVLDPHLKNFEERGDGWLEVEMTKFTLRPDPLYDTSSIQISFYLMEGHSTPHGLVSYGVGVKNIEVRPKLDV